MKILQSAIIRALTAIVVGALIIKYREETVQWLTVCIGILFLITGLISCAVYYSALRKNDKSPDGIAEKTQAAGHPSFPIVGLGSIVLGIILAVMPAQFIEGLTYVLAAMLVLGALHEYFNLGRALRYCQIGWFYWLMPTVILLIAILVITNPKHVFEAPLFILGWCMMVYGVADGIVAFMLNKSRKIQKELAEQEALEEQRKLEEQKASEEQRKQEEQKAQAAAATTMEIPTSSNNISFVEQEHEIEIEPE